MAILTDRQRLELALPAYLLFALCQIPGAFVPSDPALAARAEADVAELRENLRIACLEPFDDLAPRKRQATMRRLERIAKGIMAEWAERPSLGLMMTLWYFLSDLIDREVLILWQDSAMDRAVRRLSPMLGYGFEDGTGAVAAQARAGELLARLQAEGLYR